MGKHYTLADSSQLQPVELANQQNVAVAADTDILAAALPPLNYPTLFRVMVAFSAAGILRAIITKGVDTQTVNFNSGNNLAAASVYVFDLLVHNGGSVNFRYSVAATLQVLRVQEIDAGVQ
jgi:hypothetical protein